MNCTKLLTIATLTVAATLSMGAQAADNVQVNPHAQAQALKNSKDPNKVIVDTLFSNASAQDKARLQDQIAKYSQLQYGFGTAAANPSPQKDADVLNNIKSHDPATVKAQMAKMREAAKELPNLQKIQSNSMKP